MWLCADAGAERTMRRQCRLRCSSYSASPNEPAGQMGSVQGRSQLERRNLAGAGASGGPLKAIIVTSTSSRACAAGSDWPR